MSKQELDNEVFRRVRKELNRRPVDCSRVQISVSYGVVFLSGEIRPTRGLGGTLKQEYEVIRTILLHIPGARELSDSNLRLVESG
jgi:hypothetical protein